MEDITVEGVPGTGGLRPGETDRLRIVGHRGQSEWQPPRRRARSAGGARLRCGLEATRKQGHGGGVGSRRGAETPRTELREQARGARRRAAGGCGGRAAAAGFARLCVVAGSLHNHVSSTAETLIFDERRGTTGGIESTLFPSEKTCNRLPRSLWRGRTYKGPSEAGSDRKRSGRSTPPSTTKVKTKDNAAINRSTPPSTTIN